MGIGGSISEVVLADGISTRPALSIKSRPRTEALALQLQGSLEMRLLRYGLMASPPDRPSDDERGLDLALG
jgi:hypothetical protein